MPVLLLLQALRAVEPVVLLVAVLVELKLLLAVQAHLVLQEVVLAPVLLLLQALLAVELVVLLVVA